MAITIYTILYIRSLVIIDSKLVSVKLTQSQQQILSCLLEHSFLSQLVPDRLIEAFDPGNFPVESSDLASEIFQNIYGVLVRYFYRRSQI